MIDGIDLDFHRRDRAMLEHALRAAGVENFKGKTCRCPWHDDKTPSAGIFEKDGIWKFRCHACDDTLDVFDVLARNAGKQPEDIIREFRAKANGNGNGNGHNGKNGHAKKLYDTPAEWASQFRILEDLYEYRNPTTNRIDLLVARFVPHGGVKRFIQGHVESDGKIADGKGDLEKFPLYNRTRLLTCDEPILVEGEKKVKALHKLGIVATSGPGGAKNIPNVDFTPLNGKKRVIIWRDNDASGETMQAEAIRMIEMLPNPPPIYTIDPAAFDLPEKGDVVDFIALWGGDDNTDRRRAVDSVIASARIAGASHELNTLIEDTISGKRASIPFRAHMTGKLTQALLPGTVTVVCGDPEVGKSFWILEEFWRWHRAGIKVDLFELEDTRADHLLRVAAQMSGESRLTDAEWVKQNPNEVRQIYSAHEAEINEFGKHISTAPDNMVKLKTLNEWIKTKCENGAQIIGIDPITAAETGAKPWIEDKEFLILGKATVRHYGARLILVTHPRIGVNLKPGLASISGGASYARFSHTCIWMQKHPQEKTGLVRNHFGDCHGKFNRTAKICKARNARGGGMEIGFFFDPQTLLYAEQGIILKEDENGSEPEY
jgi:hypothetical protein